MLKSTISSISIFLSLSLMYSISLAQDSKASQEIFRNALIAAGGTQAFQNIRNFRIVSRADVRGSQSIIEMTVTETILLPDKTKQVFELEQGTRVQTLDGGAGWKKLGDDFLDLMETERLEMQRGLFRDMINIFKNYENTALQIKSLGIETVAGKSNHVLQVKSPDGDFVNLYVDSELYFIAKKSYFGKSEAGPATLEEIYSDYHKVGGVMIPFHIDVRANGRKFMESDILEADLNIELPSDFFYQN